MSRENEPRTECSARFRVGRAATRSRRAMMACAAAWTLLLGIACGGSDGDSSTSIVVDTLLDEDAAPAEAITLRRALADAANGQSIFFDASLDGGTIELTQIEQVHTILKGEVMGIRNEPSGPVSYLVGYFDRDYGRSALYARKDVVLDASDLPSGITIAAGMSMPTS